MMTWEEATRIWETMKIWIKFKLLALRVSDLIAIQTIFDFPNGK